MSGQTDEGQSKCWRAVANGDLFAAYDALAPIALSDAIGYGSDYRGIHGAILRAIAGYTAQKNIPCQTCGECHQEEPMAVIAAALWYRLIDQDPRQHLSDRAAFAGYMIQRFASVAIALDHIFDLHAAIGSDELSGIESASEVRALLVFEEYR